jgi:quinol monooxygenase YgiN
MTDGFVVLAEFDVSAAAMPAFLGHLRRNAEASVRVEPGCRRFDILQPSDGSSRLVLYEIYESEAAFDAHLQSAHFAEFRDATDALVDGRWVRRFALTENVKQQS